MRKRSRVPLIIGGAVAGFGLACAARSLVKKSASRLAKDVHLETSISINQSPEELYSFWRDFTNLTRFMKNLTSVTDLGNGRSHWVIKCMDGGEVEWDAEIYNERENEFIAWRSVENADIVNAGTVRFQRGASDHGTYVRVTVNYNPPGGALGKTILQILGSEPKQLIREDLRRFKQLMETGEIATNTGQTSGRARFEDSEMRRLQAPQESLHYSAKVQ